MKGKKLGRRKVLRIPKKKGEVLTVKNMGNVRVQVQEPSPDGRRYVVRPAKEVKITRRDRTAENNLKRFNRMLRKVTLY